MASEISATATCSRLSSGMPIEPLANAAYSTATARARPRSAEDGEPPSSRKARSQAGPGRVADAGRRVVVAAIAGIVTIRSAT